MGRVATATRKKWSAYLFHLDHCSLLRCEDRWWLLLLARHVGRAVAALELEQLLEACLYLWCNLQLCFAIALRSSSTVVRLVLCVYSV